MVVVDLPKCTYCRTFPIFAEFVKPFINVTIRQSLYNMVPLNSTCAIMLNSELQNMFAEDFGTTNDPGQIELAAAGGTFGLRAKALVGG